MRRNVQVLFSGIAMMLLSFMTQAQISSSSDSVSAASTGTSNTQQMSVSAIAADETATEGASVSAPAAGPALASAATSAPAAAPTPVPASAPATDSPAPENAATPPPTPVPSPAPKINVQIEDLKPSAGSLEKGRMNYARYCADCHGANGEGKKGPKLIGSLIVTGPVYGHLSIVLNGHSKSMMPTWGISEISDDVIASIITYQRNSWGNNDKKEFGRHAGGVVSAEWVHVYRKMMKNLPVKQDVRT
ncbi:MAG: cytochrome c [Gammaproteobacteria bacterium]|nr:cytochrome c [Gammaproteobacteria bacterium]